MLEAEVEEQSELRFHANRVSGTEFLSRPLSFNPICPRKHTTSPLRGIHESLLHFRNHFPLVLHLHIFATRFRSSFTNTQREKKPRQIVFRSMFASQLHRGRSRRGKCPIHMSPRIRMWRCRI